MRNTNSTIIETMWGLYKRPFLIKTDWPAGPTFLTSPPLFDLKPYVPYFKKQPLYHYCLDDQEHFKHVFINWFSTQNLFFSLFSGKITGQPVLRMIHQLKDLLFWYNLKKIHHVQFYMAVKPFSFLCFPHTCLTFQYS